MYENIGGKIKMMAKITAIVLAAAAVIAGIAVLIVTEGDGALIALPIMIIGPFFAWISSFILYGFGELIDKVSEIERNTRGGATKSREQSKADDERVKKLERLRSQGLITEEEYRNALEQVK